MEQFLSEPITPDAATGNPLAMARGEPGLPIGFTWRGRHYVISSLIEQWKTNADAGEGRDYLRRHWFKVKTTGGDVFSLYCLRHARSTGKEHGHWWAYSIQE